MGIFSLGKKFERNLEEQGLFLTLRKVNQYLLFILRKSWYAIKEEYVEIKQEDLKVISHKGKTKIYWKGLELTAGIGITTSISVLGSWYDSNQSDWSLKRINNTKLIIKNRWKELPLNQIWEIALLEGKEINLRVKMELEEDLKIDGKMAFLMISESYDKWRIPFEEGRITCSKDFLPDILFIFEDDSVEAISEYNINIEDGIGSKVLKVHIPEILTAKEYLAGVYGCFSVTISLFDKDAEGQNRLNAKCEEILNNKHQDKMITSEKAALSKHTWAQTEEKDNDSFRVVLANLPWQRNGRWGVRAGSRWPHIKDEAEGGYLPFPFYLAYAASLLKKNDFEVRLMDAIAEEIPETAFLNMLNNIKPDLLLVETSTISLNDDLALLKKIDKNIPLALCGPDINIRDPLFLKNNDFIKYVLVGEYEFILLDLVKHLRDGKSLSNVLGLIYRDNKGEVNLNPQRPLIKDLDELPWPLREQLPVKKYLDAPCEIPYPTAQMWASRGCPFRCIFCLWPQIMYGGNLYRVRDVVNVVDEMEYLVKEIGFKSIYFDDDTFNIGKSRMLRFCEEIKRRKLKVPWSIMARADLMDKEILTQMKEAGLYAVKYGVESAVQELLDNSNKNMDFKKAKEMIELTKQLGIRTHLTFTFGLPGETKETIQRTIDCAFELDPDSAQFSITTYYPGTEYFEYLDKKGLITSKGYSDCDWNFKGVIQLEGLTIEDLEKIRKDAVARWLEHVRLKRGLRENYQIFKRYLRGKGKCFTLKKTISYLGRRYFGKSPVSLKRIDKVKKNYWRIFWELLNRYGTKLTFKKIAKYLITGRAKNDYLDIMGIFDGSYAYKGPNFVQIDLTNNCNNDCIGCWCNSPLLGDKKQDEQTKAKTISYSKVKELVSELCRLGTKEIYLAGGGEPFMHPEIMDVVEYIKQKKLTCDINTNFTLVDEDKIKALIRLKVDSLVASVWAATAKTYVAVHPNKDEETFYRIKERLKLLNSSKDGFPFVCIYNVISNLNFHEIERMVDFALDVKAESVVFTVLDTIPHRTDVLLLNDNQRKEVLAQCERIKRRRDLGNLEICEFDRFIRRISSPDAKTAEYDKEIIESMPCYIGWLFSRIMADGNMNACLKAHRIPVGNIYKDNFSRIWNGKLQQEFRRKTLTLKKDDPYFSLIGNDPQAKQGCYKSCDDLTRNMYIHNRIASVSAFEKITMKFIANSRKLLRMSNAYKFLKFSLRQRLSLPKPQTKDIFDIALIVAPPWAVKMPLLGVAYLAIYLKQKGFNPFVYDLNLRLHNDARKSKKIFWQISNLNNKSPENVADDIFCAFKGKISLFVNELLSMNTRVIGFSTNLISLWVALEIVKLIKAKDPERIIIFGGPGCFWDYKRVEPGLVDAFVIGEGEEALCDILNLLREGKKIKDIPGVVTLENSKYSNLIPRSPLDIKTIPFPTFSEFELKEYNKNNKYKPLPLLTSRGCIGRCSYCIDYHMWGKLRCRTAESIFNEIEHHIKNYGKTEFEFNDLICNGDLKVLEEFSDLIIKSSYKINWVSYAIIRKDMSPDLFAKFKKGGCHTLIYGMESGSNTVLKRMNKYYTAEEAERVIRLTHQAGICTNINIIVGFPGESEFEFNETVEFLKRNKEYIDEVTNVSGCVLFLESEMGHNRDKFGIRLPEGADPLLYEDSTGIGPEIRKARVERLLSAISDIGIRGQIINNPTDKRIKFSKSLNAYLQLKINN